MAKEQHRFVISKSKASYLVTVEGMEVVVSFDQIANWFSATKTIADTLQILGNTKLALDHQSNPAEFLKTVLRVKRLEY